MLSFHISVHAVQQAVFIHELCYKHQPTGMSCSHCSRRHFLLPAQVYMQEDQFHGEQNCSMFQQPNLLEKIKTYGLPHLGMGQNGHANREKDDELVH